jgi:hypothetical protein
MIGLNVECRTSNIGFSGSKRGAHDDDDQIRQIFHTFPPTFAIRTSIFVVLQR